MAKLKDIRIENIEGEEKIWHWNSGERARYYPAKHTFLKCNACGKKFSLNYTDKNFEEAKLEALNKKWEHQNPKTITKRKYYILVKKRQKIVNNAWKKQSSFKP